MACMRTILVHVYMQASCDGAYQYDDSSHCMIGWNYSLVQVTHRDWVSCHLTCDYGCN
jgi:hypothetical protein